MCYSVMTLHLSYLLKHYLNYVINGPQGVQLSNKRIFNYILQLYNYTLITKLAGDKVGYLFRITYNAEYHIADHR